MAKIGVLTSGGDAQGMNATVRAVVRMGLALGAEMYAIYEGYRGLIDGGARIRPIGWNEVGGILHKGGTIIGSARCHEFRTRNGRLQAVRQLLKHGIDRLVVIGGDGSLTGADVLRQEWAGLVEELTARGEISAETAAAHAQLTVAGLAGSIDNDLCGTDNTIGADTALHRIVDAIDAISSTAASHQRTFVVEVMGRNCGYLAMMSAIAAGADWALIPENPPNLDNWEERMCQVLRAGRDMGRRDSIVVIAEGARDRHGNPISSNYVKQVLEERLGEDTRVTILGHMQRGGSPSAFDRTLATLTGARAVEAILEEANAGRAFLVGIKGNQITETPLAECLRDTQVLNQHIANGEFELAVEKRGESFKEAWQILRTLVRAMPRRPDPNKQRFRIAVLNAGGPAPGMNQAVRAAVRLGIDKGHTMLGVYNGFQGLIDGDIHEFNWMTVNGWMNTGGAELGTNRRIPTGPDFYGMARHFDEHQIDGLLVIGGWSGYEAALTVYQQRHNFRAFNIPVVCLPATIDNDLPGCELSIGADTALNCIMDAVDKIKQSAVASRRVFVIEVMGGHCGYLALISALATGAERVYLPEEGVRLMDLQEDVHKLMTGFRQGKRLGMMIRSEYANDVYTTSFMKALFEEEGRGLFDVRQAILGHLQQGGNPTPFDRIEGSLLALKCLDYLEQEMGSPEPRSAAFGLVHSEVQFTDFDRMEKMMDSRYRRPHSQWWLSLRPVARIMSQPNSEEAAKVAKTRLNDSLVTGKTANGANGKNGNARTNAT